MDEAALGLSRVVVPTAAGPVVARVGAGDDERGLLLIHGAAGSWRAWIPMLREAARAGRPLPRVAAVDLPGWGESPEPVRPLDAGAAAEAVVAVARAVGVTRWTVVGHSLGGVVALEIAVREPDRTERVVLVSPTGPAVLDAIRRPVRGGVRLPWFAGMLLAMRVLSALPGGGRPLLRALGRTGALGVLAGPLFADRAGVDPQVLRDFGEETRPAAFVRAARSAARLRLPSDAVRCAVRSVRGGRDRFIGARDATAFARVLPGFRETVVPGAGHFALAERPEAVLAVLDD
ncbi:alpha/beta fold hydrolase [Amnibacterium kyonggiense]|uniref:Pimeloyl-ACP methyl ester carboxylesterase n=1 Tax=Amnibacterium kyonggiense TaxID=595671 RepID=A0A4R7FDJ2_9MICO|nr:alpha/beta hydrolase [Amnibacterium kyonggiense]TDS75035.1 pimeloyl-ACP methyl ester carboxylesterase [Amnibacterium kyonggiense]